MMAPEETKVAAGSPGSASNLDKPNTSAKVKQMTWLETLRRDGCLPLKTIGFFTGMALTIIACLTFASKLLDLNVVGAINQVWLAIFGLTMMLLEASTSTNFVSKKVSRWLNENMKILTYMTGRGLFYCFLGTIELGFWFSTLHLVIGIILCVLGVVTIFVGFALGMKLRSIRRDLAREDDARKTFQDFDEDQDGRLSTSELARLCHSLGSKLTHNELQAAVTTLDVNRDGYIQEEEFLRWWRGDAELKKPIEV
ncbi:golgi apparatus membrane protein tvp15 [Nannochloropsis oceanica]